ncbi:hypothetical protein [Tissierella sp.]|uniref:hypothetical protein n=1 Tax=Tissierella sp. TaxID=41274 RepID=UPI002859A173|nr:hypothetical protein [Tissierella sp.]MDR7855513.1 hypothetical protein [Tissierella sp.]
MIIMMPEISIILDIDSKLTKTPAMWSLALALNCTLGYYTKKHDKKLLNVIYDDQSAIISVNGAALMLQAATDQETMIITGKAVKEGAKITIMTQLSFDIYFFAVLQSNLLQSLPVVTDDSLQHDLRLLKRVKNPSVATQKLFHGMVLEMRGEMNDTY